MAATQYLIPSAAAEFESEIKRSRFICYADHADNREAAEHFIRSVRERHPQARHVCWAYIAGAPDTTVMSMSDDGEPSGTAGMPMLKVLQYSGMGEVVVAVVRYFGGTKLGTGGLQRAYSDAVSGVLELLSVRTHITRTRLLLTFDFALESQVRHILSQYDVQADEPDYQQQVSLQLAVAAHEAEKLITMLTNHSAGAIHIKHL
ncbi:YigZ family protein [Lacimicrobium alkaliphilum]|uniref:IMPACT family protein n=1 Tax=Lacimicrobium alkaliphilum TaxID=1526571 RepID=A0A0U3AEH6_9ALTE|nr:YigZ family protein [Lacimicrobium alkaliphilum]ALS99454.1 IMPACT family protein [Lacimicrobium alkaliphilum]